MDTRHSPLRSVGRPRRRRAKIVCTIGPASSAEPMLRALLRAGMDVARLNFSHGSHDDHGRTIARLRRAAEAEGRTICILQDLQGPKIRTGRLQDHTPVPLQRGSKVTITPRDLPGTATLITTNFRTLAREVEPGAPILLADGLIELRVLGVCDGDVECEVVNGGLLGEHKGINLPGAAVQVPALTDKDRKDLDFGLRNGVDAVAVSFVRTAEDVLAAKRRIAERDSSVPVIAKLEKPQAIEHLEEILEVADGVMVARGDLGVEMPAERVPIIQKRIIRRAAEWRKPVITATQMLESMIENPRPTRAEASDVANAVFDGSDALMLSGETATGKYPREAVAMMERIIRETEGEMAHLPHRRRRDHRQLSIAETICEAVASAAHDLDMRAVAVFTETGTTARLMSKFRPRCPVYAFSSSPGVRNRTNLLWGVHPAAAEIAASADEMVLTAERELLRVRALEPGDIYAVVAGTQKAAGATNFMRLHVAGPPPDRARERRGMLRYKPMPERRRK
jgi:pyruvate kinase